MQNVYFQGSFAIDFLGGFASHYSNVTNTIVKISPVAGRSKHGLLLNCHTDTAIGSPGEFCFFLP